MSWKDAVHSQVGLKPITIERMPALGRRADAEWDAEDSSPYRLAKPIAPAEKRKRSRGPGIVKSSYRGLFSKSARFLRWINEVAYGISILFIMLTCVGFAMQVYENAESAPAEPPQPSKPTRGLGQIQAQLAQADLPAQAQQQEPDPEPEIPQPKSKAQPAPVKQNKCTVIGITGIVVLNLVRLIAGLANLIVIPFRKSPLTGVLFLIPPITFFHIWRHWDKLRKPVGRVIGPAFALTVVVLAYAYVPGLSRASRTGGSLQHRLEASVNVLHRDVTRQVKQTSGDVKRLSKEVERKLPGQLERAKAAAQSVGNRVQEKAEAIKHDLPATLDRVKKTGDRLRESATKAVAPLKPKDDTAPTKSPSDANKSE
ncbi:MAG TPA: hypothetical protein VG055_20990 [Planctomycetaceae bacterium]|jgi:hypothetical protein|nr:hypothetical protein [Planctomycetaceae bacterium]